MIVCAVLFIDKWNWSFVWIFFKVNFYCLCEWCFIWLIVFCCSSLVWYQIYLLHSIIPFVVLVKYNDHSNLLQGFFSLVLCVKQFKLPLLDYFQLYQSCVYLLLGDKNLPDISLLPEDHHQFEQIGQNRNNVAVKHVIFNLIIRVSHNSTWVSIFH